MADIGDSLMPVRKVKGGYKTGQTGKVFKTKVRGRASNPHEVALDAYQRLIERGAGSLLREYRG